jgi:hypothetical protein
MTPVAPIAVLVDVDNVLAGRTDSAEAVLEDLIDALAERFGSEAHITLVATATSTKIETTLHSMVGRSGAEVIAVEMKRGPVVDVVMAVRAVEQLPTIGRLVLVSGDSDFIPVVEAARRAGVQTTVVSAPGRTAVGLSLAADERIDAAELWIILEGLVAPGQGASATTAVMAQFRNARHEIVVIDPYIGEGTLRLLAWARPSARLILIGQRIEPAAIAEAKSIRGAKRTISIRRHRDIHDRWFRVDGRWWHSGGSLKDLGRKYSRISAIENDRELADHDKMLADLLASGDPAGRLQDFSGSGG